MYRLKDPETVLNMAVERCGKIHFNSLDGCFLPTVSFHLSWLQLVASDRVTPWLGCILGPCEESWAVLIHSVHSTFFSSNTAFMKVPGFVWALRIKSVIFSKY